MSFDEQIRQALDRVLTEARGHLEANLHAFADALARAAEQERERAVQQAVDAAAAEVRRQAEAQLAQIREVAYRQGEELKRTAEMRVGEFRTTLQAQLEEVRSAAQAQVAEARRTAEAQIEEARNAAEARTEEVRRRAEAEVEEVRRTAEVLVEEARRAGEDARRAAQAELEDARRAAQAHVEQMRATEAQLAGARQAFDEQLEEARRRARVEIEEARAQFEAAASAAHVEAEDVVMGQLAFAQADAQRKVNDAVERARTDAHQTELANAARILDAIRTLDETRTLGDVLDALAVCAAREVDRAAVLVVKGEQLRGWRFAGFDSRIGPAKSIELTVEQAGVAGAVVRTGVAVSRLAVATADQEDTRQPALPPFAEGSGARHAMAWPVLVGGHVVAVLYADGERLDTPSSASRWPAMIEVLARHASRALEAMTVEKATGLSLPRPVARASHAPLPGPVEQGGIGDEEDAARGYARLLVSEIRMFHEPLVDAGRRSRDLRTRLGGEIDRARRLYEARVAPAVRDKSDFFEQELVRTLANGDRSLLG